MCKKVLALLLALVMVVTLLPTAAFATAGGVTEPMADEDTPDGSSSSDDAQLSEDIITEDDSVNAEGEEISDSMDFDISEPEPAPISIGDGVTDAEKVKNYFVNGKFTGTYVTKRDLDGRSDVEWSIKIDETGEISLLYNGVDTGAKVTAFNSVSSSTGKPGGIVFSHDDWYTSASPSNNTKATIAVSLNSSGYFTMPSSHIYWDRDKDGTREDYYFTSTPYYYNETVLKNFFRNYPGDYTIPDGSGWKVTVDGEGNLTMASTDGKADGAFINYININASSATADHEEVTSVEFTSPDWYNSSGTTAYQKLTLKWTTVVSNTYERKAFQYSSGSPLYNQNTSVLKGFSTSCYFIADNGIFSYEYFKGENGKYAGDYSLTEGYKAVYGGDIIKDWSIFIEDGHVYLCEGTDRYEAVMTSGTGTSGAERVSGMAVYLPGWYTNKECTAPAYIALSWAYNSTSKTGALYFTTTGLTVYKFQEDGEIVQARIPAMRFEHSTLTALAKSKLAPYHGEYLVNDGTDEKIVIQEDGTPVLHIGGDSYTALYYNFNNSNWLTSGDSDVKSVVFSAKDWFAAGKTALDADRSTIEMTWDAVNQRFTAAAVTFYEENSSTDVSRAYGKTTTYSTQESLDEATAYMIQYVNGEYTFNDGSGWKIKVDGGKVYTKFGTEDYVEVKNTAPEFKQDATHTEYGNGGKYLDKITVPAEGWYSDDACTREAFLTLTWNGKMANPIDDHKFTVAGIAIYRKTAEGAAELKYISTCTAYSDADRAKGEAILKDYAGTYHPTAAKDKWYIAIDENGKPTIHTFDFQGVEHTHADVAFDLNVDKNTGKVTGVSSVSSVITDWRKNAGNSDIIYVEQCPELSFSFYNNKTHPYFTSGNDLVCAGTKADGSPWVVQKDKNAEDYNKTFYAKLSSTDEAYSDAVKEAAKEYFGNYSGIYYIDDPDNPDYHLTITEDGEIYWGSSGSGEALLADVIFDGTLDGQAVPKTINVWYNGYTKEKSTGAADEHPTTARGNLTWNTARGGNPVFLHERRYKGI